MAWRESCAVEVAAGVPCVNFSLGSKCWWCGTVLCLDHLYGIAHDPDHLLVYNACPVCCARRGGEQEQRQIGPMRTRQMQQELNRLLDQLAPEVRALCDVAVRDDAQWVTRWPVEKPITAPQTPRYAGQRGTYLVMEWHPNKDAFVAGTSEMLVNWELRRAMRRYLETQLRYQILLTLVQHPEQLAQIESGMPEAMPEAEASAEDEREPAPPAGVVVDADE